MSLNCLYFISIRRVLCDRSLCFNCWWNGKQFCFGMKWKLSLGDAFSCFCRQYTQWNSASLWKINTHGKKFTWTIVILSQSTIITIMLVTGFIIASSHKAIISMTLFYEKFCLCSSCAAHGFWWLHFTLLTSFLLVLFSKSPWFDKKSALTTLREIDKSRMAIGRKLFFENQRKSRSRKTTPSRKDLHYTRIIKTYLETNHRVWRSSLVRARLPSIWTQIRTTTKQNKTKKEQKLLNEMYSVINHILY